MIRVLICDDHLIVRQGLRQVLADADGIEVAAEAEDGAQAVRLLAERRRTPEPIGVVLLDIAMPHRNGLDVLRQLRSEHPALPVLMLSTYPDKQYAVRCLKLGASGYLNKSADSEQMAAAIRKVAGGGLFITSAVAEQVAASIGAGRHAQADLPAHERFSRREHQVFQLLAAGGSVGEIAAELSLSPNTVSTYRARVLEKTGARNDVELALYAVRAHLLPL